MRYTLQLGDADRQSIEELAPTRDDIFLGASSGVCLGFGSSTEASRGVPSTNAIPVSTFVPPAEQSDKDSIVEPTIASSSSSSIATVQIVGGKL